MHQDISPADSKARIHQSLRSIAVGSYLFQTQLASELGLNATDLEAIHRLGRSQAGLSAGALAAQLGLTSGATSVAIDRLVSAGYVKRAADPNDGRGVKVVLHTPAEGRLQGRYEEITQRIDSGLEDLNPTELGVIDRFLGRLAEQT